MELRDAETQSVIFASGVAEEAQVPVNLDFVAVNIELEDFETAYEFTVFDAMSSPPRISSPLDCPSR